MNDSVVLSCRGLSKSYQQGDSFIDVLHDVSLDVHRGESIAIVGTSGAGKSTLLHLLGGLDKPDQGEVRIGNQNIAHLNERQLGQLRNRNLGFVYQFHHLLPEFTALENINMPLRIAGMTKELSEKKSRQILSQVGLENRLNHRPSELSGGERQRAAIARALVTLPSCVLADEPTGNLDNKTANDVYEVFLELNREFDISLLMVTHDESMASRMNRVVSLCGGALTSQ